MKLFLSLCAAVMTAVLSACTAPARPSAVSQVVHYGAGVSLSGTISIRSNSIVLILDRPISVPASSEYGAENDQTEVALGAVAARSDMVPSHVVAIGTLSHSVGAPYVRPLVLNVEMQPDGPGLR
jgi:hypothetical protein